MTPVLEKKRAKAVVYPESDGKPMAENTVQFRWIVTIEGGIDALFAGDPHVFVAGDLFWYPVEGDNTIKLAPDILVAFGRPKGDRKSYLQWEENGVAPQVIWEILSESNRPKEMIDKFLFYEKYGVEEYYIYDPFNGELSGWIRDENRLVAIPRMLGWVSPRLKVRFELFEGELFLVGPDGRRFATYLELIQQRELALREIEQAQRDKELAQQQLKEQAQVLERLRAQLKASGIEPQA